MSDEGCAVVKIQPILCLPTTIIKLWKQNKDLNHRLRKAAQDQFIVDFVEGEGANLIEIVKSTSR